MDSGLSTSRPAWVEAIVRDALRPVEERLDELNGPLVNIERRLRRQRAQLRKARKLAQSNPDSALISPQFVPVLAPELIQSQAVIEQYVQRHTAQLEKVTQNVGQIVTRLGEFDQQMGASQAERQALSQQFPAIQYADRLASSGDDRLVCRFAGSTEPTCSHSS